MLGKNFSNEILNYFYFVLFFLQKIGFDISCKLSGDNLHEMSKPISGENKKNIINCWLN